MKFGVCAGYRQVFGLAGCTLSYLPLLPSSLCEPVHWLRLSFLLTAAGQFRIYTGFPRPKLSGPVIGNAPDTNTNFS